MNVEVERELLDRQIVDRNGRLIGRVDDVGFAFDDDGVPYVAVLLTGQVALARRLGGRLEPLLTWVAARFTGGPPRPRCIPFALVATVNSAVELSVGLDELPEPGLEGWLRRRLVERIPGAEHEGGTGQRKPGDGT